MHITDKRRDLQGQRSRSQGYVVRLTVFVRQLWLKYVCFSSTFHVAYVQNISCRNYSALLDTLTVDCTQAVKLLNNR